MVQYDGVAGAASDGDQRRAQWDRRHIGHRLACDDVAVMIGQRDHRAVLVPDANHVPIVQDMLKRLVALIVFPLIEDAIRRFVLWL